MKPHTVRKHIDKAAIAARMYHAAEQLQLLECQAEALLGAWSVRAHVLTEMIDLQDRLLAGSAATTQPAGSPSPARATAWESRRTALILPDERVAAMWARAERWHVSRGGRFQTVESTLLLWSGARPGGAAPRHHPRIMAFAVAERWCPAADLATFTHLAWRPDLGGSAATVWQALEVLAGGPLVGLS